MSTIPVLRSLGGGNFRKLCVIIVVILVFTVWVSCTTEEEEREQEFGVRKGFVDVFLSFFTPASRSLRAKSRLVAL
jgi:solute carrier family 45 protein 1/2/4